MVRRDRAAVRMWLEQLGYQVAYREQGWTECLVWRTGERWLGRGSDESDALADAVNQMVPSHAARVGIPGEVLRALQDEDVGLADAGDPAQDDPVVDVQDALDITTPLVVDDLEDAPESPPAPEPDLTSAPEPAPPQEPVDDAIPTNVESQVVPARAAAPEMNIEEALDALDPLVDRIAAERPELGLATPQRQRLVLLAWICRARAVEDASGEATPVVDRVAGIAKDLTGLCKLWWPGSVNALQLYATPSAVGRELDLPPDRSVLRTWTDAADATEETLARVIERDLAAGRDEYGWADGASLLPAPRDPEAALRELRARIEKVTGSIDEPPPKQLHIDPRSIGPKDVATFVELARFTRWLRGSVVDFVTWSRIAGRLRWLASRVQRVAEQLGQTLDPAFRPSTTWAAALGRDPGAQTRKRERLELYRRIGEADANDAGAVRACLVDGLRLLGTDMLGRVMRPFRDVVLAINSDELVENTRTERRRLRKLRAVLEDGSVAASASEVEAETEDIATTPAADEPAIIDPTAELFARVRPHTEGRRAAFVSNRNDPELGAMLREAFGFAEIDWCEGTPRRVQDIAARIGQGAFEYVLAATGFQSHSVDGKLFDACKRAKVPYVRVNKGRPVACAVAILRRVVQTPVRSAG